MLKTYNVFKHPKFGEKIERAGFTFLGLFFTFFWLAAKRLYFHCLAVLLIAVAAVVLENMIEKRIDQTILIHDAIQSSEDEAAEALYLLQQDYILRELERLNSIALIIAA